MSKSSPPPRPAPRATRIVIADDHEVVRAGLRSLLSKQPDWVVVGEAGSADQLLERVRSLEPDVVVTDLRMPRGGVLDAIRALTTERPLLRVVIFTAYEDTADAVRAFHFGASGYVLKQAPGGDVVSAIRRSLSGKRYVNEPLAARMMQEILDVGVDESPDRMLELSERETNVLSLISRGYTGPEIAKELGVRIGTVESYRHRIRKKLGLKSRAEVIEFARAATFRWRDR